MKRKEAFFSISAVAKMFSVHQQTIRLYEKEGLLTPKRSAGNTRLFSEEDINRLEEIIYLTHELGINLAGVEMIFKLKKQISKLQKDMNRVFEQTQKELEKQVETSKNLAQTSAQRLVKMKKDQLTQNPTVEKENQTSVVDVGNWHIDYED